MIMAPYHASVYSLLFNFKILKNEMKDCD